MEADLRDFIAFLYFQFFSASCSQPKMHLSAFCSATVRTVMGSSPSGIASLDKHFFLKLLFILVFYQSNRKAAHIP